MNLAEYQVQVRRTVPNNPRSRVPIFALGVAGEAGEVAEIVKKLLGHGLPLVTAQKALLSELGDVLWYITALAMEVGIDLEDVAQHNVEKLQRRYPEGFVQGGGVREATSN